MATLRDWRYGNSSHTRARRVRCLYDLIRAMPRSVKKRQTRLDDETSWQGGLMDNRSFDALVRLVRQNVATTLVAMASATAKNSAARPGVIFAPSAGNAVRKGGVAVQTMVVLPPGNAAPVRIA